MNEQNTLSQSPSLSPYGHATPQLFPPFPTQYGKSSPSPALYHRSASYPFGNLVPRVIQARRSMSSSHSSSHSSSCPSSCPSSYPSSCPKEDEGKYIPHVTEGCEYDAWVDSDGDVWAMLPSGAKVGPFMDGDEYKVIGWWRVDANPSGLRMDFNDLLGAMIENLADGYSIEITAEKGECSIDLFDFEGNRIEFCDDDLSSAGVVMEAIRVSREKSEEIEMNDKDRGGDGQGSPSPSRE